MINQQSQIKQSQMIWPICLMVALNWSWVKMEPICTNLVLYPNVTNLVNDKEPQLVLDHVPMDFQTQKGLQTQCIHGRVKSFNISLINEFLFMFQKISSKKKVVFMSNHLEDLHELIFVDSFHRSFDIRIQGSDEASLFLN